MSVKQVRWLSFPSMRPSVKRKQNAAKKSVQGLYYLLEGRLRERERERERERRKKRERERERERLHCGMATARPVTLSLSTLHIVISIPLFFLDEFGERPSTFKIYIGV